MMRFPELGRSFNIFIDDLKGEVHVEVYRKIGKKEKHDIKNILLLYLSKDFKINIIQKI